MPISQSAPIQPGSAPIRGGRARNETLITRTSTGKRVSMWPMVIVIYATLLPREACIHLGGNYLYADRLALLVMLPWILRNIWKGAMKFVLPDWLILIMGLWIIIAFSYTEGLGRGFVSGSAFALDAVGGYYLARISFRSLTDVRRGLIMCAPGIFLAAITLPMESISHHLFVRPTFEKIFGAIHVTEGTMESQNGTAGANFIDIRHGLLRAYGPFVHPILGGLFLSTLIGIYWMSGIRGWPRWLALAAAGLSVFSISSSTFLAIGIQVGLLTFDWLSRWIKEMTWRRLFIATGFVLVGLQTLTKSGLIAIIIRFMTLDPGTGYFRVLIWYYGWLSVLENPWFGIGLADYSRPAWMITNSIDSHYLLLAVRFGVIAPLMLLLAAISALIALGRCQTFANTRDKRFYRGIMISLFTFVLMGFTVYIFGGTQTWFTILLGACVACSQHGFFWVVIPPEEERAHAVTA